MDDQESNSNKLVRHLIVNSLFTERQLSIISKRLQGSGKPENISSGAYYRQVKQCQDKVLAALYTMILLQSTGIIQQDGLVTLGRLAEQMRVIFSSENHDILPPERITDITSVMDQLVKRVSNL